MDQQPEKKHGPDLLKILEAAEILKMGKSTVYKLVSTKELPSIRIGRMIRISREDIDKFLSDHRITRRTWI
jgi:excisionase family DNA binding protein